MSEDELDELLARPRRALTNEQAAIRRWLLLEWEWIDGLAHERPSGEWKARIGERGGRLVVSMSLEVLETILGRPHDAWEPSEYIEIACVTNPPFKERWLAHVDCESLRCHARRSM